MAEFMVRVTRTWELAVEAENKGEAWDKADSITSAGSENPSDDCEMVIEEAAPR